MDKKLNLEKGKYYICQNTIAEEKAEKKYPSWRNEIGDEFSENSACVAMIEKLHELNLL